MHELFESHTLNLVAGSPATGKTTLLLQYLAATMRGESFLGYQPPTEVRPFYIALDKTPRQVRRRFAAIGVDETAFPWVSLISTLRPTLSHIKTEVDGLDPRPNLIVLEAIARLTPNPNDYNAVGDFLSELVPWLDRGGLTMVGTTHSRKYIEPWVAAGDRVMGTSLWRGGGTGTVVAIQPDPKDPSRQIIAVEPRESPKKEVLGQIVEPGKWDFGGEVGVSEAAAVLLAAMPAEFDAGLLEQYRKTLGFGRDKLYRLIGELAEAGLVLREGRGSYVKQ